MTLTNKRMTTREIKAWEVVKTDNGDGTYRLSIEDRGYVEVKEASFFRRIAFIFAEKIIGLFLPKVDPKITYTT